MNRKGFRKKEIRYIYTAITSKEGTGWTDTSFFLLVLHTAPAQQYGFSHPLLAHRASISPFKKQHYDYSKLSYLNSLKEINTHVNLRYTFYYCKSTKRKSFGILTMESD